MAGLVETKDYLAAGALLEEVWILGEPNPVTQVSNFPTLLTAGFSNQSLQTKQDTNAKKPFKDSLTTLNRAIYNR
jgi:hypothetical protein